MKFYKSQLDKNQVREIEDTISFKEVHDNILELNNIKVKCYITLGENIIHILFNVNGLIKVRSSYTLKPLDYNLKFEDEVDISDDENNIDAIYVKGNEVDLNQIIYDLISGHVPTRIVGKNEKCEVNGDGFSVMSEKDYKNKKDEERSSPFDVLKDLDI